jgi:hypothetical protein
VADDSKEKNDLPHNEQGTKSTPSAERISYHINDIFRAPAELMPAIIKSYKDWASQWEN